MLEMVFLVTVNGFQVGEIMKYNITLAVKMDIQNLAIPLLRLLKIPSLKMDI
jgi:hypothetical protein